MPDSPLTWPCCGARNCFGKKLEIEGGRGYNDKEEWTTPPVSLPPGAIPVPEETVKALMDAQRKITDMNLHVENYLTGLRHGLKVPDGWKLDMQVRAFVPPQDEEGQAE